LFCQSELVSDSKTHWKLINSRFWNDSDNYRNRM